MRVELKFNLDGKTGTFTVLDFIPSEVTPTPPSPLPVILKPFGDLEWNLHPTQLWPVPPVLMTNSISFVADQVKYPNGVMIKFVDESHYGSKDYVISDTAHSFEPVGGSSLAAAYGAGSTGGPLYLRFGPAQPRSFWGVPLPSLDVALTPGQRYYINFRAADGSGGIRSSQFVCELRQD